MPNVKCTVAYDGTLYCGYQRQKGQPTVQAELEKAIERIFAERATVYASGRTDSGVHALGQVVNFRTSRMIPTGKIPAALNSVLPADIVILLAEIVPDSFHARISARQKTYTYRILNSPMPCPFTRNYALHLPGRLDAEGMSMAAELLIGTHDYASFQATGSSVQNTVRTIVRSSVHKEEDTIVYTVTANGFLYNMVRVIVGTLIEVGRGKLSVADVDRILHAACRSTAGPTAPAHGLFLQEVEYSSGIDPT